MKPNYRDVLLAVKYCHFEFWDAVPWNARYEIAAVTDIVFNGQIDPASTYNPQQLLRHVTEEYKDDVVAALLELEMSEA